MVDLDRRAVLAGSLGSAVLAATSATAKSSLSKSAAIGHHLPDVVVVGAGAFGAWTALCLRERGAQVTLIDSFGAGNARQTSGDETRQIRAAYGDMEIYSRWATRAFTRWHERQSEFKRRLIFANGVLSPNEPDQQYQAENRIFTKLSIPFETLTAEECKYRWPQGGFQGDRRALYEPNAGTVKARESIIAATEVLTQKGGVARVGMAKVGPVEGHRMSSLQLSDGSSLSAGIVIFACGAWLPQLFPDVMKDYLSVVRSEVFYVGSPAGDLRYHWERFPNLWMHGTYSLSDVDYGYKVAPYRGSVKMDPDSDERIVSPFVLGTAREFVAQRVPGLIGQPIVASRVCQLESSNNGDFIIDTHPGMDNVWIAGGGSGHAFKMGPVSGEYIADRVLGIADPAEEKALFALSAHHAVDGTVPEV